MKSCPVLLAIQEDLVQAYDADTAKGAIDSCSVQRLVHPRGFY